MEQTKFYQMEENEYNERNINLILNCFKDAEKANPTRPTTRLFRQYLSRWIFQGI